MMAKSTIIIPMRLILILNVDIVQNKKHLSRALIIFLLITSAAKPQINKKRWEPQISPITQISGY